MKTEKNGGRPKKETIGFEDKRTIGFKSKKTNGFENDKTTGLEITKTETKPNVNENVNVNVNENVNDNENVNENDLYFLLLKKYKEKIQKGSASDKIRIISQCKNSEEYASLTLEQQDKLFIELMSIGKKFK